MTKDQIKHIKKLLIDQELSISELAKRVGCKPPYISLTIHRKRRNARIQEAIAREWGLTTPQEIFADGAQFF